MIKVKVIKRYQNRKLYDTQTHKYISMGEIARLMMLSDIEVIVIDNETKNDITNHTLLSVLMCQSSDGIQPRHDIIKNLIVENLKSIGAV